MRPTFLLALFGSSEDKTDPVLMDLLILLLTFGLSGNGRGTGRYTLSHTHTHTHTHAYTEVQEDKYTLQGVNPCINVTLEKL